jgi:hypothetical protein
MAKSFQEGDRVQVVDRAATSEDEKTGLFYSHFRGLTGTIQKIYASQEVAVEVETESLTENVAHRHHDVQETMKTKWLDGLSDEARNRLSERERDFRLRYTILVALKDLTIPSQKPKPTPPASTSVVTAAPVRKTAADYEADEQAYLQSRQRNGASEG